MASVNEEVPAKYTKVPNWVSNVTKVSKMNKVFFITWKPTNQMPKKSMFVHLIFK